MIENKELFARINQKDGMVSFQENPEQYDSTQMSQALDQQIQRVLSLGSKVKMVDQDILASASYIQKTSGVHGERGGRWSGVADFDDFDGADKASSMMNFGGIMGKTNM